MNDLNQKVLLLVNVEDDSISALRALCDELLSAGTILHIESYESIRTRMKKGVFAKKIKPRRGLVGETTRLILPLGQLDHVLDLLNSQLSDVVAYALPVIAFLDKKR